MKSFIKQERYIVIKRKYLSFSTEQDLRTWLNKNKIETESGVFIQADSRAIDQAWALLAGAKSHKPVAFKLDLLDLDNCEISDCEKSQVLGSDFCLEHTEQMQPPKSVFSSKGKLSIKNKGDTNAIMSGADALMVDVFTGAVADILADMQRQELRPPARALVYSLAHLVGKANPDREHMHRLYGDWLNVLREDAKEFIRCAQKGTPTDKHIQEIAERVHTLTFELSEPD